jgi:hypothetical protein
LKLPAGGTKRQAMLFGALVLVLLLALVRWRPGGEAPAPGGRPPGAPAGPAPGRPSATDVESGGDTRGAFVRGAPRRSQKEISPDEVPELSVKDLGPSKGQGTETGRDLFELREPTHTPLPTATPRPPIPGDPNYIGPLPPPPPTPTPHPPDVTFKFIGTFGPKDAPIAVIQQGDQTFNARAGDTLFGKYVLRKVGYESIDVGFVGFPQSETKRLGITQ